jgi:predicted DNA-binding antitoxin AbrB/MazE fold protein
MPSLEAIYENGVLRPLEPLDLAEGARLEVTIVKITAPNSNDEVNEADYAAFLGELDKIASLPYSPHPDGRTDVSTRYDEFLYPQ